MTKRRYAVDIDRCGYACPFHVEHFEKAGCKLKDKEAPLDANTKEGEFPSWCPLEKISSNTDPNSDFKWIPSGYSSLYKRLG